MGPGTEWVSVYLIAIVILSTLLAMIVGVVCWFAHLRWFGATLMFGGSGALVGLLGAGVLFVFASRALQPPQRPLSYSQQLDSTIVRDPSVLAASHEVPHRATSSAVARVLGLLVPAATVAGAIIGMHYAHVITRERPNPYEESQASK